MSFGVSPKYDDLRTFANLCNVSILDPLSPFNKKNMFLRLLLDVLAVFLYFDQVQMGAEHRRSFQLQEYKVLILG